MINRNKGKNKKINKSIFLIPKTRGSIKKSLRSHIVQESYCSSIYYLKIQSMAINSTIVKVLLKAKNENKNPFVGMAAARGIWGENAGRLVMHSRFL